MEFMGFSIYINGVDLMKKGFNLVRSVLCTILAILLVSTSLFIPVASADYSTGVGLAAHALNAYYNNWSYAILFTSNYWT